MSIADKLELVYNNVDKVYEAGQKSMVDESKIIEKTITGVGSVVANDVSEVPHEVQVQLSSDSITDFSGIVVAKEDGKNLLSLNGRSVIDFGAADKSTKRVFPNEKGIILRFSASNTYNPEGITDPYTIDVATNSIRYTVQEQWIGFGLDVKLKPNTTYSFGCVLTANTLVNVGEYAADGSYIRNTPIKSPWSTTSTITTTADTAWGVIAFSALSGTGMDIGGDNLQFEVGTTATEYEPPRKTLYTADTNGVVSGIKSMSPKMSLQCYTDGVDISMTYHQAYGIPIAQDVWWDAYQQNGTRVSYACAFGGSGWTDELFKPKYDIQPTEAYMMFRSTNIKDLTSSGVKLDFSKVTNVQYMFQWATTEKVGVLDFRNVNGMHSTFAYTPYLHTIEKIILKADGTTTFNGAFESAPYLANVTFEGVIGNDIAFPHSALSAESMANIAACLKDYSTQSTVHTITFRSDRKTVISSDAQGLIEGKRWSIAWL